MNVFASQGAREAATDAAAEYRLMAAAWFELLNRVYDKG